MNFIKKTNTYLLEHHPLIWNTRLLWMLIINIFSHLLFFGMGLWAVNDMEDLKLQSSLSDYYSDTSIVYYNYLISILTILVWIILYLRNNAFKNFYRLQRFSLFKEFCIIIMIFFMSSSQFWSFKRGIVLKVRSMYSWEEVDQDIKAFNRTGVFLTQAYSKYEIEKKQYPDPFPLEVAVENENDQVIVIDTTRAFFVYKGFRYQFYHLDKEFLKEWRKKYPYQSYEGFEHRKVKDVAAFKDHIDPTLFNYSSELFGIGQDSLDLQNQIKSHEHILNAGSSSIVDGEITELLGLLEKYQVDHNLNLREWSSLVNNPPLFPVRQLIRVSNPNDKYSSTSYYDGDYYADPEKKYVPTIPYTENLYCNMGNLKHFFGNVYEAHFVRSSEEMFFILFSVLMFFGVILFIFKTTNLKSVLLSIVAALILLVIIVMLMSYASRLIYNLNGSRSYLEYTIMIFISSLVILTAIASYVLKWKKILITIAFSLGVYALPLLALFASLRYSEYLRDIHGTEYNGGFVLWFREYSFYFIIAVWILGIFVYSDLIKRLQARPE